MGTLPPMKFEPALSTQVPKTRWGGIPDARFGAGGYFRVAERNGVFWFVDPDGGRFLSQGVNTVRFDQDAIRDNTRIPYAEACKRKYGSEQAWRTAVAARLQNWGFNTLGCWSDEKVAHTESGLLATAPNLDLGMSFARARNTATKNSPRHEFPDVFDENFERHVVRRARALCAGKSNERCVVGWFIDNELRWGPDWRGPDELLTLFLALQPETPGRVATLSWLRRRYTEFLKFNAVWHSTADSWDNLDKLTRLQPPYHRNPVYQRKARDEEASNRAAPARTAFFADCDEFAALVADRYFSVTTAAIKAADSNHLILGSRFAYVPPAGVIASAARYLDVISLNCYDLDASPVIEAYASSGKPCLIGEFSFRGADSGLPNTNGGGLLVATQTERAASFRHYVSAALRQPAVVGFHWFEHADQPAEGRFDGENSNYGTVSINDDVYEELAQAMTSVNAEAHMLHADAGRIG